MNRSHSEHSESFPRINSLRKYSRAATQHGQRNKQEQIPQSEDKKNMARLSTQRKALQSANASKAVRYQATNAIYLQKIEVLEKQNLLLDKEIASVNSEISNNRVKKRVNDQNSTVSSKISMISKRSLQGSDQNISRLQALRKRVDKEKEKNKQLRAEIDKVRRMIVTSRHLMDQLTVQLKQINQKLQYEIQDSSRIDQEIIEKKERLKQKKIQSIHQKTHLIKHYENILKKIDQQLENKHQPENEHFASNFYLTDVYTQASRLINKPNAKQSPKNKHNPIQIDFLKEKIKEYENHFSQLKEKTGCHSLEETVKKFASEYEQNYARYKFINARFEHLMQLKKKNLQLIEASQTMIQQDGSIKTSRSCKDILDSQQKMIKIAEQKRYYQDKKSRYVNLYQRLKQFVKQSIINLPNSQIRSKYDVKRSCDMDFIITENNIQEFLHEILLSQNQYIANEKYSEPIHSSRSHHLDEFLENQKRQSGQDKDRMLSRQQLIQAGAKFLKTKALRH